MEINEYRDTDGVVPETTGEATYLWAVDILN
jgi:hypothetical protein